MEQVLETKKRIFSGIQPSGGLTLGNYLGALKNWVLLQDEFDAFYCVVDMHAITVRQEPAVLRRRSIETIALLLACGVDPEKSPLFIQSHVREHAMINWVLCCNTYMGELSRMTQFKDKAARHQDNINGGLFTYPVLMAGDILLYNADLVPVGADQKQHVELTRDIAERFNATFGDTFHIPEPYIGKIGARIMSLQEPDKKMSKSDPNPNAFILILDDPDTIVRKLKRAVTDCEGVIAYDPSSRPGVSNLLSIYSSCANISMEDTLLHFEGKNYGALKSDTADAVISVLSPIQSEYKRILSDKAYLTDTIKSGNEKAEKVASSMIRKIYHKVGFDSIKA